MPFCMSACLCGLSAVCQIFQPWWRSKSKICWPLESPTGTYLPTNLLYLLTHSPTYLPTYMSVNGMEQRAGSIGWPGAHLMAVVAEVRPCVRASVCLSDWRGKCPPVREQPFYRHWGGRRSPGIQGASVKNWTGKSRLAASQSLTFKVQVWKLRNRSIWKCLWSLETTISRILWMKLNQWLFMISAFKNTDNNKRTNNINSRKCFIQQNSTVHLVKCFIVQLHIFFWLFHQFCMDVRVRVRMDVLCVN